MSLSKPPTPHVPIKPAEVKPANVDAVPIEPVNAAPVNAAPVHVELVDVPIDLSSLLEKIGDPDTGAHAWFIGVTRRTTGNRTTQTLDYEAHRPMAIEQLRRIAEQAMQTFSLARVVVVHRLGNVPVGEASIVVGCSSAHRVDSFAALPWIMDTLKQDVAIWKRETYADGQQEWVHPTPSPDGADGPDSIEPRERR